MVSTNAMKLSLNYKKALEQYGFALGAGNKRKSTYQSIVYLGN